MRLYRMELYKLCHKKSFTAGLIVVLLLGLFFFYNEAQYGYCCINGTEYHGFEAIRMDRRITEEFRGALTDKKIKKIIEKYGFPQGKMDSYNRLPGNFLNTFIMEYASDGYSNDRDDYKIATRTLPLADTVLGQHYASAGMEPTLEYYTGWAAFLSVFGVLMLGVSILILYSVSVIFSKEEETEMKPLLFTTKEGPATDTLAKIAAAFSVSVGIWFLSVFFLLLLHITVYGTDGLHCLAGLITMWSFAYETPLVLQPIGAYLAEVLLVSLLAVLELCAITICVSAYCHNSFYAVVGAGICYALPFLGYVAIQLGTALLMIYSAHSSVSSGFTTVCWYFFYFLRSAVYSSPVYLLVGRDSLIDLSRVRDVGEMKHVYFALALAALLLVLCTVNAWHQYRKIRKA